MILARAPMRITLGGGGTDLPSYYSKYGGFIISAAIDKYLYIYVNRPAADGLIRVKYSRYEEVTEPDQVQHDLVRPALKLLGIKDNVEIVSMADVPAGTGLGSSSTYLVALLTSLYELKRERVPTHALAEFACKVELEMAGHPVGKQDHYLAAFGGITCLEIDPGGRVKVTPLDISITAADDLRSRVLLFFTGMSRSANTILQAQRQDSEREDPTVIDSLHRTKEMGLRVKEALVKGDVETFGHILHEHWENKKRRSTAISNPRIDRWYDQAREAGALGGKVIGAGGGGFLMLYCPLRKKGAVRKVMAAEGLTEMPYNFDFQGAKVLVNF
jgi:D-glycero-alpha-D-manno-heptose-7-phosphate kinase